ncbi:hypothetical protein DPMN_057875 [Dreissena polymorpha]|uniref:Uncharacterized protein n=1 Tax=Dreissena polymorpha TaxID=45954 RepID=A0A9D4C128_DREPO|nr:hypothetical protein DPMN_057875 [Dreissena polymorpha]
MGRTWPPGMLSRRPMWMILPRRQCGSAIQGRPKLENCKVVMAACCVGMSAG